MQEVNQWVQESNTCQQNKPLRQLPAGFVQPYQFLIKSGNLYLWIS